jgi:alkylation response protein AidB-like acyl-CoA dehydrogenase
LARGGRSDERRHLDLRRLPLRRRPRLPGVGRLALAERMASAGHARHGVAAGPDAIVCDGAVYLADPWFSGGAMRFAAVQAGVARGLAEFAAAHLVKRERADAPHQAARLGAVAAALVGLEGTLERAAAAWDAGCAPHASAEAAEVAAAHGHIARVAAERALLEVADLVQRAVGLGGLIAPHPLERRLRDALTYVRQPNPDGAREAAGRAFAAGRFAAPAP